MSKQYTSDTGGYSSHRKKVKINKNNKIKKTKDLSARIV